MTWSRNMNGNNTEGKKRIQSQWLKPVILAILGD
jgi:hypothetical protein